MKFIIEYTGAFSGNIMKTNELSFLNVLKNYRRIKKVGFFGSPKIKMVKQ